MKRKSKFVALRIFKAYSKCTEWQQTLEQMRWDTHNYIQLFLRSNNNLEVAQEASDPPAHTHTQTQSACPSSRFELQDFVSEVFSAKVLHPNRGQMN